VFRRMDYFLLRLNTREGISGRTGRRERGEAQSTQRVFSNTAIDFDEAKRSAKAKLLCELCPSSRSLRPFNLLTFSIQKRFGRQWVLLIFAPRFENKAISS
jgi:hypothetical protein